MIGVSVNQFITITESQVVPGVKQGNNNSPRGFDLRQNYPNPLNPFTIIQYSVPQKSHVILKVYNMLGQEVETLVDKNQEAGEHEVQFEPKGKASGAYFYVLQAGDNLETKKFVLLR